MGLLSMPALADERAVAELYVTLSGEDAAVVAMVQNAIAPLLLVGMVVAAAVAARHRASDGIEIVVAVALALTVPHMVVVSLGDRARAQSDPPSRRAAITGPKNDETAPIRS